MNDKDIVVALGKNRKETNWTNEYMTWWEFVERLKTVRRTGETMSEYGRMGKTEQGLIKDGAAFVGGHIVDGRRKKTNIKSRSLITLDLDDGDDNTLISIELIIGGTAYVIYSTHSDRLNKRKYRLIMLPDRELSSDEYVACSRKIAEQIGMTYFDPTSFNPQQLMYFPSCSADANAYSFESKGEPLNVDTILNMYENWQDPLTWPSHPKEGNLRKSVSKMEDPLKKPGIIGAFCRVYPISEAIEKFLSDVYLPTEVNNRYTYAGSESVAGVVVYDDVYAYSHHASDLISDREVNAFDLVRINKFANLDENVDSKTNITKLPSFKAMQELAVNDKRVNYELAKEDFSCGIECDGISSEGGDTWRSKLKRNPTNLKLLSNAHNIELILNNGVFKDVLGYDAFSHNETIKRDLPWRKRERQGEYDLWLGSDDRRLIHYINKTYDIKAESIIKNALTEVTRSNSIHPVKEYLESQVWDGVKRMETLFIDYLGADDSEYVREITKKMLVAAIKRIYEPGCKFDEMVVLIGAQGAGKSSLLGKLGRSWFSDSLKNFSDNKEASEHLQGTWIVEIGELSAMKKAEIEEVKQFLSKRSDRYRVAFDRVVSEFPRKCIMVGTTNNKNFLRDPTGGRRFWCIGVDRSKAGKNHFEDLSDELVGQIWAEAVAYYRQDNSLVLSTKTRLEAEAQQEAYYDSDEREGLIAKYLETLLPDNWNGLDIYERRAYLEQPMGDVKRDRVCIAEVWAECFKNEVTSIRRGESNNIANILRRLGWDNTDSKGAKFRLYGVQKVFRNIKKEGN